MRVRIGLETHVQLNSKSKIFCSCQNPVNLSSEQKPNTTVCPICLGMPGSKPGFNEKIIEMALDVAIATKCEIFSENFFSRKTYFYPDMSKNFQITQYEIPVAKNGYIKIQNNKIRLRRIHIEEDPAKLVHVGSGQSGYTLVDYNRSGTPLIEIVTEPDFSTPAEARIFLQKLETILEYLGVYDSTSKAVIKSDANISLSGGERIEVKNITGTKEIEKALNYEITRQTNLMKRNMVIKRETRAWNPQLGVTQSLRGKEEEEEYGYIFEADLPKLTVSEGMIKLRKNKMPELPEQKFERFKQEYKLPEKIVESIITELELSDLFEYISKKVSPKIAATWIAGYIKKTLNWHNIKMKQSGLKKEWILTLLEQFQDGKITDRNAEIVIRKMTEEKKPPEFIIKKYDLEKKEIEDIETIIKKILNNNKKAVEDYKKGEEKAVHFLVGLCMKQTKGQIDAEHARRIIMKIIK